jgi:peptidylprolyl isomerase
MAIRRSLVLLAILAATAAAAAAADADAQTPPKSFAQPTTIRELLAVSKPDEWRLLDPEATLYLELSIGRVIIELAPAFAPRHVANIQKFARAHW